MAYCKLISRNIDIDSILIHNFLKVVLINMVVILMISAKLAILRRLII